MLTREQGTQIKLRNLRLIACAISTLGINHPWLMSENLMSMFSVETVRQTDNHADRRPESRAYLQFLVYDFGHSPSSSNFHTDQPSPTSYRPMDGWVHRRWRTEKFRRLRIILNILAQNSTRRQRAFIMARRCGCNYGTAEKTVRLRWLGLPTLRMPGGCRTNESSVLWEGTPARAAGGWLVVRLSVVRYWWLLDRLVRKTVILFRLGLLEGFSEVGLRSSAGAWAPEINECRSVLPCWPRIDIDSMINRPRCPTRPSALPHRPPTHTDFELDIDDHSRGCRPMAMLRAAGRVSYVESWLAARKRVCVFSIPKRFAWNFQRKPVRLCERLLHNISDLF